jgi:hypothetical protein
MHSRTRVWLGSLPAVPYTNCSRVGRRAGMCVPPVTLRAVLVLLRIPWPTCLRPTEPGGTQPSLGPREPVLPCNAVPWGQAQTGTGPFPAAGVVCVLHRRRQGQGAAQGQEHTGQCWLHTGLLADTAAQDTPEKKQMSREREVSGESSLHACIYVNVSACACM